MNIKPSEIIILGLLALIIFFLSMSTYGLFPTLFVGFFFSVFIIIVISIDKEKEEHREELRAALQAERDNFMNLLLILSASVIKSDNEISPSEIEYVHRSFKQQFGEEKMNNYIGSLHEILEKDHDLEAVCEESRAHMSIPYRLQLIHYLFRLARTDEDVKSEEAAKILIIAGYLHVSTTDYNSIKAMYEKKTYYNNNTTTTYVSNTNYTILGITSDATDAEIKKAYKLMVFKYHPDKVTHLGEEVQKEATEKIQQINAAYKQIKKARKMK